MTTRYRMFVLESHGFRWRPVPAQGDLFRRGIGLGWWTLWVPKDDLGEALAQMVPKLDEVLSILRMRGDR